jgi:hypothetical protein
MKLPALSGTPPTTGTTTQSLFCYGTLMAPAVTRILLRRLPVHSPAILVQPLTALSLQPVQPGDGGNYSFRRHPVKSQVFPGLIKVRGVDSNSATGNAANAASATATHNDIHGILYYDLSLTEMQVLDWYEGVGDDEYTRTDCHVLLVQPQPQQQQETGEQVQVATQVYVWNHADDTQLHMDRDWSYEQFRDHSLELFLKNTVRPCREELDRLGM